MAMHSPMMGPQESAMNMAGGPLYGGMGMGGGGRGGVVPPPQMGPLGGGKNPSPQMMNDPMDTYAMSLEFRLAHLVDHLRSYKTWIHKETFLRRQAERQLKTITDEMAEIRESQVSLKKTSEERVKENESLRSRLDLALNELRSDTMNDSLKMNTDKKNVSKSQKSSEMIAKRIDNEELSEIKDKLKDKNEEILRLKDEIQSIKKDLKEKEDKTELLSKCMAENFTLSERLTFMEKQFEAIQVNLSQMDIQNRATMTGGGVTPGAGGGGGCPAPNGNGTGPMMHGHPQQQPLGPLPPSMHMMDPSLMAAAGPPPPPPSNTVPHRQGGFAGGPMIGGASGGGGGGGGGQRMTGHPVTRPAGGGLAGAGCPEMTPPSPSPQSMGGWNNMPLHGGPPLPPPGMHCQPIPPNGEAPFPMNFANGPLSGIPEFVPSAGPTHNHTHTQYHHQHHHHHPQTGPSPQFSSHIPSQPHPQSFYRSETPFAPKTRTKTTTPAIKKSQKTIKKPTKNHQNHLPLALSKESSSELNSDAVEFVPFSSTTSGSPSKAATTKGDNRHPSPISSK